MLINKLISKIALPSLRYSSLYLFAAEKKAQKPKQAPKQTPKDSPKGGAKDGAPGDAKQPANNAKKAEGGPQTQKKPQQVQISKSFLLKTDAANMYRKTIRGLTIKKKTERANFNEQSLVHIINLATKKDIELMYQAYYNYLGHFTPVSNKTVDSLIVKTVNLGKKKQDAEVAELASSKLLQVLQNHQYLGYFPHYSATLKTAQFYAKIQKFQVFLQILKNKPLIKLDGQTIKQLYTLATEWKDFITLSKILAYRANKELLMSITNQELLQYIIEGVKKFQKINVTGLSHQLNDFLGKFEGTHPEVALLYGIMFNNGQKIQAVFKGVEQNSKNIKQFAEFIGKVDEAKKDKVIQMIEKALEDTHHKDLFK